MKSNNKATMTMDTSITAVVTLGAKLENINIDCPAEIATEVTNKALPAVVKEYSMDSSAVLPSLRANMYFDKKCTVSSTTSPILMLKVIAAA